MTTTLKDVFPLLKTRDEILEEIHANPDLYTLFSAWTFEQQEEFLNFTTGAQGIKFLYDSFFKEIFNPESVPERLEEFLSLILNSNVKILAVLPNDSTRIADESSLLIMDIVVQLEHGPIVNLEIQKIGYKFPGERSACYSADLLLRQYKRVRSRRKKNFSYKDIKPVYTIVIFEHAPKEFHQFTDVYCHYAEQTFNTGLKLELLQKYVFVALDIFQKNIHNKITCKFKNKLEAWLTFLSEDDPEIILKLIETYPEFKALYEDGYRLCLNIEEVMRMFSKELAELDKNTVQLMIDEMQDELDEKNDILAEMKIQISEKDNAISEIRTKLSEKDNAISEIQTKLSEKDNAISEIQVKLSEKDNAISEKDHLINELKQKLQRLTEELQNR